MIPASVTKSLESFVPRWCRAAASRFVSTGEFTGAISKPNLRGYLPLHALRTITCILVRTPSCMEHGVLDVVPSWNQFHWHDPVPVPSFAALEVGRHPSMLACCSAQDGFRTDGYALSPLLSPLTFISAYLFSSHALLTLIAVPDLVLTDAPCFLSPAPDSPAFIPTTDRLLLPPYRPYYQRLCERWCRPTRPPAI